MADKFDEKMIDDQTKALQRLKAEFSKLTGSAQKDLQDVTRGYKDLAQKVLESNRGIKGSIDTIKLSMKEYEKTLESFTDTGINSGNQLQNMFAAIAGIPLAQMQTDVTKQIKEQNELLEKQLMIDSEDYKNAVNARKNAKDAMADINFQIQKIKEKEKLSGSIDKDAIKILNDKLKGQQKVFIEQDKIADAARKQALEEKDTSKEIQKQIQGLESELNLMKNIAGEAAKLLETFSDAFDRFVELDKAAEQFRKTTGLVRSQMVQLEKSALNVNQELIAQGVTIDKAYDAAAALTQEFSNANTVTQNQIRAVAQLNANLGVTEASAAGFLQKMESVGGLTEKQSIGMAGLAANAAKAAGVPLEKVMKDVANASGETLAMMRGNVRQMTLAAIQANRLGVDLQKSANSAKQLLSFTESVDAEMEASVLLGKNLNLNLARQLAFQGDVAGAQAETLRQVKSMGDFNKMNLFQQEALAKASGYTVDELSKMLKNEERLSKLKPEQLKAYESATKALKEQKEETGEQILQQAQMQSAIKQLSSTYIAFKQILADILTPIVNVAVKILIPILKVALLIFNTLLIPVKILAKGIQAAFEPFEPALQLVSDFVDAYNQMAEQLVQKLEEFGKIIIKMIPGWSTMLMVIRVIGTVLGKIGTIISAIGNGIRTVSLVFGLLSGIVNPFFGMLVGSFSLIGSAINLIGRAVSGVGSLFGVIGNNLKLIDVFVKPVMKAFQMLESVATYLLRPIRGFLSLFGTASGTVGRFAAGLGSIGKVTGILTGFSKAVPVIGWVIAALQGIVSMFTKLKSGTGFFKALGETLYEIFVEPFRMLFELLGKIPVIGGLFRAMLPVFDVLKSVIVGTFEVLGSFFGFMWDMTKGLLKVIYNIGAAILSVVALPFKMLFAGFKLIWTLATDVFTSVKDLITGVFKDLMSGNIMGAISKVFSFIPNLLAKAFSTVTSFVGNIFGMMFSTAFKVFTSIFALPAKLIGGLLNLLSKPFTMLFSFVKSIYDKIASFFTGGGGGGILSGIGTAISTIFGLIFSPLTTLPKMLLGAIFSFASSAKDVLVGLFDGVFGFFNGLIDNTMGGISSVISTITDKISGVISSIWTGIKSIASFIGGVFGFGENAPKIENKANPLENSPSPAPTTNPAGPGTPPQIDMLAEMQKTNDKLDQLIQLMSNGGLVVNLDGVKVSEQLAIASL